MRKEIDFTARCDFDQNAGDDSLQAIRARAVEMKRKRHASPYSLTRHPSPQAGRAAVARTRVLKFETHNWTTAEIFVIATIVFCAITLIGQEYSQLAH